MTAIPRSNADFGAFTIKAAIGLILFLFALFLAILTLSMLREQQDAEKRGEDRALSASQVVATNARWITELSRQALGRIDAALGPDIESSAAATAILIRQAVASLPGNVKAYVIAPDGRTLFSTDPNLKPIDVRDREYFAALAAGAPSYTSALMVSRLDGAQIFAFSKRLERNGSFAGAAVLSFDVVILKEVWELLAVDGISTVSLIRDDGQLIARYPPADGPLDLSKYVLFTDYLKANDVGTYPAVSPADGVTRIVGYRRVPGTDIIAVSSISTDSAFALFGRNVVLTLAFAVPGALGLAAAVIWIVRLLRSDQRQRARLVEALDLNRMLVRDTHHRVKNNLQAIMSMLRMHDLPAGMKQDLQARISAMSAVHEHLYQLDQVSEVDALALIPGIVEPIRRSFDSSAIVDYDIDPLLIDRDQATPLALLVSEVVTNALKYAYGPGEAGRIVLSLKLVDGREMVLSVRDFGQRIRSGYGAVRAGDAADPGHGHAARRPLVLQFRRRDAVRSAHACEGLAGTGCHRPRRPVAGHRARSRHRLKRMPPARPEQMFQKPAAEERGQRASGFGARPSARQSASPGRARRGGRTRLANNREMAPSRRYLGQIGCGKSLGEEYVSPCEGRGLRDQ